MAIFDDQDLTGAEWVVNGVEVTSYVEAELDRRHPVRLLMRSGDPADLWQAHRQLSDDWARTVDRLRAMPEGSEHQPVAGEWSAVQTLRHLVFVHDSWFRRCCLDRPSRSPGSGWRPTSCPITRNRASIERRPRASRYYQAGARALADVGVTLDRDQYLRDMSEGHPTCTWPS